jgi:hypothetical protein
MEEGKKAWAKAVMQTELACIKEIVDTGKAELADVFHHEGIPDIMMITKFGKLQFYEIEPRKGPPERQLLNLKQKETSMRLLRNKMVESITIVYITKLKTEKLYTN